MKKAELAQPVIQVLRGYDYLPDKNCARVQNLVSSHTKDRLIEMSAQAEAILKKRADQSTGAGK